MNEKLLIALFGAILMALQFLYRHWDKKDKKGILLAVSDTIKSFEPHVERTRRTYGIVKGIQKMTDIRDDDGRPMMYMPKEMIDTQRELVTLTAKIADTDARIVDILTKMEARIEQHQSDCRAQFTELVRDKHIT